MSNIASSIGIVDTHEHLEVESDRLSRPQDPMFIFLSHYLSTDFYSAGLSSEDLAILRDYRRPWVERWPLFEAYWDYVKTTGYGQVIRIAIRDLYGIDDITRDTYPKLVEAMTNRAKPGFYNWVLDKANISRVILDHGDNLQHTIERFDKSRFSGVIRFESFIYVKNFRDLMDVSRRLKAPIHSLADYENALRRYIREVLPNYLGVKTSILAYEYSLKIEYVTFSEAEYALKAIIGGREAPRQHQPSLDEVKPLHDYLFRVVLSEVEAMGKPIQIHTGIQEDDPIGNPHIPTNVLQNANPVHLVNLFKEYPNVKFILFHASYPYSREAGVLAKQWPNVYLDLCWMHEINPRAYADVLGEWLEMVPNNKIMAFGGDYIFIEGTYGASVLARRIVGEVVEEKVSKGHWDRQDAERVARRVLRENAERVFKIS